MLKTNELARLKKSEERFIELEKLLADADIAADQSRYGKLAKEFSGLTSLIEPYRSYQKTADIVIIPLWMFLYKPLWKWLRLSTVTTVFVLIATYFDEKLVVQDSFGRMIHSSF